MLQLNSVFVNMTLPLQDESVSKYFIDPESRIHFSYYLILIYFDGCNKKKKKKESRVKSGKDVLRTESLKKGKGEKICDT